MLSNLYRYTRKYCQYCHLNSIIACLNLCLYSRCRPMESDTVESEKLQETNEEVSQWESRFFCFVFGMDLFKCLKQQFVLSPFHTHLLPSTVSPNVECVSHCCVLLLVLQAPKAFSARKISLSSKSTLQPVCMLKTPSAFKVYGLLALSVFSGLNLVCCCCCFPR